MLGGTGPAQAILVGHWTFDDNTANDSSGMGHHGTLAGAGAAIVNDPIRGLVYSGDGSDSKVDLGNPAGLNIVGQFTAAAWVRPLSIPTPQENAGILQRGHQSGTGIPSREFILRIGGTPDQYQFGTWTPTHNAEIPVPSGDENWWVHLAGTMTDAGDGTFIYRLYRNGELVNENPGGPGLLGDFTVGWAIGARGGITGTEREFEGFIDDVRMYDNPLTQAEIQAIMGAVPVKGDVDLDGDADINDYDIIRNNLHTGTTLAQGDANLDGTTNLLDFRFWKNNRTDLVLGAGGQAATESVPEPSALALALLGMLAFAVRRFPRQ
jgi:hypothetical protein